MVARTNALVDGYERGLRARGFVSVRLSRKLADNRSQEGVRLTTMHRIKGLEFRHVMLAAVNEGVIPPRQAIESSEDPTERRAGELTERALFHVTVTRAMSRVFISYFGRGSFLVGPR